MNVDRSFIIDACEHANRCYDGYRDKYRKAMYDSRRCEFRKLSNKYRHWRSFLLRLIYSPLNLRLVAKCSAYQNKWYIDAFANSKRMIDISSKLLKGDFEDLAIVGGIYVIVFKDGSQESF